MSRTVVLFDFDGTISKSDSLLLFLKFYFPRREFIKLMSRFVPVYAKFKLGRIKNGDAKERLFEMAFSGESFQQFDRKSREFYGKVLKNDLYPEALASIKEHCEKGHRVVLVSASIQNYLEPFSKDHNMELICTQLEVAGGKLTGKFQTPNCYGSEKVNRILSVIDLSEYREILVYGDSRGDREMMELATRKFYRPFR
ncbi:HAD family hydrolase [Halocola ammonii]